MSKHKQVHCPSDRLMNLVSLSLLLRIHLPTAHSEPLLQIFRIFIPAWDLHLLPWDSPYHLMIKTFLFSRGNSPSLHYFPKLTSSASNKVNDTISIASFLSALFSHFTCPLTYLKTCHWTGDKTMWTLSPSLLQLLHLAPT